MRGEDRLRNLTLGLYRVIPQNCGACPAFPPVIARYEAISAPPLPPVISSERMRAEKSLSVPLPQIINVDKWYGIRSHDGWKFPVPFFKGAKL